MASLSTNQILLWRENGEIMKIIILVKPEEEEER
jgi:hypothetical protein